MKTLLITQARIGSNRLPKKVLLKIGSETMLSLHLKRVMKAKLIDDIVVATTHEDGVEEIINVCNQLNVKYYQGSTNDVLDRFYNASKKFSPDWVVRVTSDCPLIDPDLIDQVVKTAQEANVDYCSNSIVEDFPDGQDIEVFKFSALRTTCIEASLNSEREHVTSFIRNNSQLQNKNKFFVLDFPSKLNYNSVRMTVDQEEDLKLIRDMVEILGASKSWEVYADYIISKENTLINKSIIRNKGYLDSLEND